MYIVQRPAAVEKLVAFEVDSALKQVAAVFDKLAEALICQGIFPVFSEVLRKQAVSTANGFTVELRIGSIFRSCADIERRQYFHCRKQRIIVIFLPVHKAHNSAVEKHIRGIADNFRRHIVKGGKVSYPAFQKAVYRRIRGVQFHQPEESFKGSLRRRNTDKVYHLIGIKFYKCVRAIAVLALAEACPPGKIAPQLLRGKFIQTRVLPCAIAGKNEVVLIFHHSLRLFAEQPCSGFPDGFRGVSDLAHCDNFRGSFRLVFVFTNEGRSRADNRLISINGIPESTAGAQFLVIFQ